MQADNLVHQVRHNVIEYLYHPVLFDLNKITIKLKKIYFIFTIIMSYYCV